MLQTVDASWPASQWLSGYHCVEPFSVEFAYSPCACEALVQFWIIVLPDPTCNPPPPFIIINIYRVINFFIIITIIVITTTSSSSSSTSGGGIIITDDIGPIILL